MHIFSYVTIFSVCYKLSPYSERSKGAIIEQRPVDSVRHSFGRFPWTCDLCPALSQAQDTVEDRQMDPLNLKSFLFYLGDQ